MDDTGFAEPAPGEARSLVIAPQITRGAEITRTEEDHTVVITETPDLGLVLGTQKLSESTGNDLNVEVLNTAEGRKETQPWETRTPPAGTDAPTREELQALETYQKVQGDPSATLDDLKKDNRGWALEK